MALDFTTGVLDPRVTVARALNTATRVNASGLIEIVNADLPRFDYDPITLAPKGLLIEESRTNLLRYSAQLEIGAWGKTRATITANATVAPDGASTADKIVEDTTASSTHFITQVIAFTAGTTYVLSAYVKADERNWFDFQLPSSIMGTIRNAFFDVSNGTLGTVTSGVTAAITFAGNGWYRCSLTFTPTASGSVSFAFLLADADNSISYTGDGTSGLFVWGAQLEAGAFATSYIPTTTASLTRNADVVSMTGTNFSDWYNASEGAFLAKFSFPAIPAAQFRYVLSANDGTATNFIAVAGNTTSNVPAGRVIASSSTQASMGGGAITANQQAIGVIAYKQDSFAYGQNGATIGTDATGLVPTVNRLDIGALTTSFACCHIQRVAYWPQRIINNEALAFSK
jgi:hypothetical protein